MIVFAAASATTDPITGIATIQMVTPGAFISAVSKVAGSCRIIVQWEVWFGTPLLGDCITAITANDINGVVPVPNRVAFPNYPILVSRIDSGVSSPNNLLYIPPDGIIIKPDTNESLIPSQIAMTITAQKGSLPITPDILYINMWWDDMT